MTQQLPYFIEECSLYLVPHRATHHTAMSDTWLDLCRIDALDSVTDFWKTDTPFIMGHDSIIATSVVTLPKPETHYFTYNDFKSINATASRIGSSQVTG